MDTNQNNIKYWYYAVACNTLDVITPLIEFLSTFASYSSYITESTDIVIGVQSY